MFGPTINKVKVKVKVESASPVELQTANQESAGTTIRKSPLSAFSSPFNSSLFPSSIFTSPPMVHAKRHGHSHAVSRRDRQVHRSMVAYVLCAMYYVLLPTLTTIQMQSMSQPQDTLRRQSSPPLRCLCRRRAYLRLLRGREACLNHREVNPVINPVSRGLAVTIIGS